MKIHKGVKLSKAQLQTWRIGDIFLVENLDGTRSVGQVVSQEKKVLNCVSCAFFDRRMDSDDIQDNLQPLVLELIFAVLFVTRDLLDNGTWRVVGHMPIMLPSDLLPYESLRSSGYVGAKIVGSANVNEFLNAFYGLSPWDDWKDPAYLDKLLISPDKKPSNLKFKH